MADSFGLKFGIEGEKEFKNALREINQSFRVLGSFGYETNRINIGKQAIIEPANQETKTHT